MNLTKNESIIMSYSFLFNITKQIYSAVTMKKQSIRQEGRTGEKKRLAKDGV
jgi:hypothetical protein